MDLFRFHLFRYKSLDFEIPIIIYKWIITLIDIINLIMIIRFPLRIIQTINSISIFTTQVYLWWQPFLSCINRIPVISVFILCIAYQAVIIDIERHRCWILFIYWWLYFECGFDLDFPFDVFSHFMFIFEVLKCYIFRL